MHTCMYLCIGHIYISYLLYYFFYAYACVYFIIFKQKTENKWSNIYLRIIIFLNIIFLRISIKLDSFIIINNNNNKIYVFYLFKLK